MKRVAVCIGLIAVGLLVNAASGGGTRPTKTYEKLPVAVATKLVVTWDDVWGAICHVESGGNPNAVGDGGLAIGVAQIQPIMVRDCNRIVGRELFSLQDRRSPIVSRLMFDVYMRHYGAGKSLEWRVRAWNGGPTWEMRKRAGENSKVYWEKVRQRLEQVQTASDEANEQRRVSLVGDDASEAECDEGNPREIAIVA